VSTANGYTSGTISTGVSRTALSSVGDLGKNIGAHPGISAVTPKLTNDPTADNTNNASSNSYGAAQDDVVLGLVDATAETGVPASGAYSATTRTGGTAAVTSNATSANGLRIREGNGNAAPTESNMVTTLGSTRDAFNLLGNDEVTNPTHAGTGAGGTTGTEVSTSSSTFTNPNGSNPHGSNAESEILKGQTRYYCAAIFFPADTDQNFSTVYASAAAGNGTVLNKVFPLTYNTTTNQWNYCVGGTAGATCASLGTADTALTAANTKGDNAATLGSNTYYMVVTAAQKAGRTVN
jgi:hypothetical protein